MLHGAASKHACQVRDRSETKRCQSQQSRGEQTYLIAMEAVVDFCSTFITRYVRSAVECEVLNSARQGEYLERFVNDNVSRHNLYSSCEWGSLKGLISILR